MSPTDAAAPAANALLADVGAFTLTVLAGVIVSLVTLWLAGRQRAKQEAQAAARRREAVLDAIGRELRWNRRATHGELDASNAHVMVGALTTVAFEAHAGELASIAPESVSAVYEHYGMVGRAREGIRALGPPGTHTDPRVRQEWVGVCVEASIAISSSATEALNSLQPAVED